VRLEASLIVPTRMRGARQLLSRRPLFVSALVVALVLATGAAADSPALGGGTLVFATGGDGVSNRLEIASVNADGSGFRKLTHVAAPGFAPRWSTDGRRIIFLTEDTYTREEANWRMRADGSRRERLPGYAWDVPSPSGDLVYTYNRILDAKGKVVRRLRPGLRRGEYYTEAPLWSPNGRYVVLNAARIRATSDAYDYSWIHLVPTAAGGRGRPLTPRTNGRFAAALSWSPDSRRLLIEVVRGRYVDWDTVAPDGSDRRRLFRVRAVPGSHTWSPDSRRIAYVGRAGGIFVISATGGNPHRIATTRLRGEKASRVDLDWSSRDAIAFSDKGGTYVMRADGRSLRRLTTRAGRPDWSPDGWRIVLSVGNEIYVIDRRGHERRLTQWVSDNDPELSPDGRRVAFVRGHGVEVENPSVYVMNADGKGQRRLGTGSRPRWSRDGDRVAYVQDRPLPQSDRVVVADANGGGSRDVGDGDAPSWSPDGRLAFMRYEYVFEDRGDHGGAQWYVVRSILLTARADGGDERTLAVFEANYQDGPVAVGEPAWSPDGRSILLVGDGVLLVDAVEGTTRTLHTSGAGVDELLWSPDGGRILASNYDAVSVIDMATGTTTRLVEVSGGVSIDGAAWSPDGSTVGFVRCTDDYDTCDIYAVAAQAGAKPRRLTKTFGTERDLVWGPA
jgi:Tol biopolymer transport system component